MILTRYFYAIIWTFLLIGFVYTELVFNFLVPDSPVLNDKIIELLNSKFMILSNAGLVAMLFVDSHITKKILKDETPHKFVGLLVFTLILVIALTVFAEELKKGTIQFPHWFPLSYLFFLFLSLLTVYKAETLNIKHNSSIILNSTIQF